jgi:hypothetical protein
LLADAESSSDDSGKDKAYQHKKNPPSSEVASDVSTGEGPRQASDIVASKKQKPSKKKVKITVRL